MNRSSDQFSSTADRDTGMDDREAGVRTGSAIPGSTFDPDRGERTTLPSQGGEESVGPADTHAPGDLGPGYEESKRISREDREERRENV